MDFHAESLSVLCRFCGTRVSKRNKDKRHSYKVTDYIAICKDKFNLDVSQDLEDIHPPFFCTTCYCQLTINQATSWTPKNDWQAHKRTSQECPTCELYHLSQKPGRPVKKKRASGRPPAPKTDNRHTHFAQLESQLAPPTCTTQSQQRKHHINQDKFHINQSHSFLICGVCSCVVSCPVETPCHHLFCVDCLRSLFCKVSVDCPICNAPVHYSHTAAPPPYTITLLNNFHVTCQHCSTSLPYTQTTDHTCHHAHVLDHTYSKPQTQLDQRQIQQLATDFVRNQFAQSHDGNTATFGVPGRGQPIKTTRLPQSFVSSDECSALTKRRRSSVMQSIRKQISKGADREQQSHEASYSGLSNILGPDGKVVIPANELLELKSFFGFSWRKLRRLKSWLQDRRVQTAHEGGVRQLQNEIIGDNLQGENVPMQMTSDTSKDIEIKATPLVSVKNVPRLIHDLLDEYEKLHELTWHNGVIPDNEVWIKIGGDKGGGTFKMMLQPANVSRPNSLHNTRVILLFPGSDSVFNLQVALQSFTNKIEDLSSSTWRGKKIRLFAFGDYEFLCRMYGLSGPSGRHCCLYCTVSKQDMAIPPEQRLHPPRPRTLETLKSSLEEFQQRGIPKEANNVIRPSFFKIPIDQVCPPGLHISLGIFLKHFNSLSNACHLLDLAIAQRLAGDNADHHTAGFKKEVHKLELQARVEELAGDYADLVEQHAMVALLYDREPPATILEMAEEKKRERTKLEKEIAKIGDLSPGAGPVTAKLETVLQKLRICRQAYHGRSFVGNHVHKCLIPENVDLLTQAIPAALEDMSLQDPHLTSQAEEMEEKYNKLLNLYGACHRGLNSGSVLHDDDIQHLDLDIRMYMEYFREKFPNESVTPKQHLLEEHTIPWLQQWRASPAMLGEQGGEAVHCQLNTICRDLRGYHDDLKLNMQAVKNQWIISSPTIYHKFSTEK